MLKRMVEAILELMSQYPQLGFHRLALGDWQERAWTIQSEPAPR